MFQSWEKPKLEDQVKYFLDKQVYLYHVFKTCDTADTYEKEIVIGGLRDVVVRNNKCEFYLDTGKMFPVNYSKELDYFYNWVGVADNSHLGISAPERDSISSFRYLEIGLLANQQLGERLKQHVFNLLNDLLKELGIESSRLFPPVYLTNKQVESIQKLRTRYPQICLDVEKDNSISGKTLLNILLATVTNETPLFEISKETGKITGLSSIEAKLR